MTETVIADIIVLLSELDVPHSVISDQLNHLLQGGGELSKTFPATLITSSLRAFIELDESPELRQSIPDWPSLDGVSSKMKTDWRPKMQVSRQLAELSGRTPVEVWELRDQFVSQMRTENKYSKFWNVEFVQFVMNMWWESFYTKPSHIPDVSETTINAPGLARIWALVRELRSQFRVPYNRISKKWQPSLDTAHILEKRGIHRGITYNKVFISGFINRVELGHIPSDNLQHRFITHIEDDVLRVANLLK